jgi:lipopolysaccharide/colanic/teichoic acid biosynthesis glycosyltransferase
MIAKRLFDLVLAIPGLIGLSPFFMFAALWIRLDSPGPVFFRQERVGRFGRPFRIYKFRTMCSDAEAKGRQLTVGNDPRITRSGAFLRRYKLDELPQLINVILGDMSLVGPRPEVPKYVACYPPEIRDKVLSVPPGITDYASIEYRDENTLLAGAVDPEQVYISEILPVKLDYYSKYVTNRSLLLDSKLILLTLKKIL